MRNCRAKGSVLVSTLFFFALISISSIAMLKTTHLHTKLKTASMQSLHNFLDSNVVLRQLGTTLFYKQSSCFMDAPKTDAQIRDLLLWENFSVCRLIFNGNIFFYFWEDLGVSSCLRLNAVQYPHLFRLTLFLNQGLHHHFFQKTYIIPETSQKSCAREVAEIARDDGSWREIH